MLNILLTLVFSLIGLVIGYAVISARLKES